MAFRTFFDLLPVLLLFALGAALRATRVLDRDTIAGIKRLVVNLTLPVLLFDAFFRLQPDLRNLFLVVAVFLACVLMIFGGRLASRALRLDGPYAPLMFEGFEAGMLGYALFLGIAGDANLPYFAASDLGQVLFVFSILQAQLRSRETGARGLKVIVRGFVSSPVVVAIAAGLLIGSLLRALAGLGSTGVAAFIAASAGASAGSGAASGAGSGAASGTGSGAGDALTVVFASFWRLAAIVKALTMPLICFVIGADIELDRKNISFALRLVAGRIVTLGLLAFVVGYLFAVRLLGLPPIYGFAVLVLFLLPPPFVIPVFMLKGDEAEGKRVATTLSLHSLASILVIGLAAVVLAPR